MNSLTALFQIRVLNNSYWITEDISPKQLDNFY